MKVRGATLSSVFLSAQPFTFSLDLLWTSQVSLNDITHTHTHKCTPVDKEPKEMTERDEKAR